METDSSSIYRCRRCATKVHGRDQLQPHLHWHNISDKNVDAYFTVVEETADATQPANAEIADVAPPRKSEPSYGVLVGCVAILALLGIAYYLSN